METYQLHVDYSLSKLLDYTYIDDVLHYKCEMIGSGIIKVVPESSIILVDKSLYNLNLRSKLRKEIPVKFRKDGKRRYLSELFK